MASAHLPRLILGQPPLLTLPGSCWPSVLLPSLFCWLSLLWGTFPHPIHLVSYYPSSGFSLNVTSLGILSLKAQSSLLVPCINAFMDPHFSFIEIITSLVRYSMHLMFVSASNIRAGRGLVLFYVQSSYSRVWSPVVSQ